MEVKDRDEFEAACRSGWIAAGDAAIAETTMAEMRETLERRLEPWGDGGWHRLTDAKRQLEDPVGS